MAGGCSHRRRSGGHRVSGGDAAARAAGGPRVAAVYYTASPLADSVGSRVCHRDNQSDANVLRRDRDFQHFPLIHRDALKMHKKMGCMMQFYVGSDRTIFVLTDFKSICYRRSTFPGFVDGDLPSDQRPSRIARQSTATLAASPPSEEVPMKGSQAVLVALTPFTLLISSGFVSRATIRPT